MADKQFRSANVTYTPKEKRLKNESDAFSQKEISYDDTPLIFPPGMEKVFLVLYFISLPYITGLMFLFFYVGEGKTELFFALNEESSFILTWAIGYEILATLLLLFIIKAAISFSMGNAKKGARRDFQRP